MYTRAFTFKVDDLDLSKSMPITDIDLHMDASEITTIGIKIEAFDIDIDVENCRIMVNKVFVPIELESDIRNRLIEALTAQKELKSKEIENYTDGKLDI